MTKARKSYPSDVSDAEWAFCAPYLTLMKQDAPQRAHSLRELYNGLRWFVRAGCPWRMLPNDLPPWYAVQQQTQRWLHASCFETMAEDLRALLRLAAQRDSVPTAVILDSRTLPIHAGEMWAWWLRWGQETQRQQGARSGGYAGPFAGGQSDCGQ
jgi:transposase